MRQNAAGQTWNVFAYDTNANAAKAGDAANITATINGTASNDVNPAEIGGGIYAFTLTAAETNHATLTIAATSVTPNVTVVGVPVSYTTDASVLNMTWYDICREIEAVTGNTTALDALGWAKKGYDWFISGVADPLAKDSRDLIPHAWSFMQPEAVMSIGGTLTLAGYSVSGIVTFTTGEVDSSCTGLPLVVATVGYPVDSYISPTSVKCSSMPDTGSSGSPVAMTIQTAGQLDLPSDFGGLVKAFYYPRSAVDLNVPIEARSIEWIKAYWRDYWTPLISRWYGIGVKPFVEATGTRYFVAFAPLPYQARTVCYRYRVVPPVPTDSASVYPLGGQPHARTIINCAVAKRDLEKGATLKGPLWQLAVGSMQTSINTDHRFITPGGPQSLDANFQPHPVSWPGI
jgi:hypothetical protein